MGYRDLTADLERISACRPPVRRAAYSDRTAWLLAILAELAYCRFDEEDESALTNLASELAGLDDPADIKRRLRDFRESLGCVRREDNHVLRSILKAGGFELRGVLFDQATDTQGFVAAHHGEDGVDMAVVSFRGTQQTRDWITNLNFAQDPVDKPGKGPGRTIGHVHSGFNRAFRSVEVQTRGYLRDLRSIPLYLTGHSLGGALAVLATWYLSSDSLAACYTFGSPRVGDHGLLNHFRTPIYRIVNGADPVPLVPPSGRTLHVFETILRVLARSVPVFGTLFDRAVGWVIAKQGFRHYGSQRYLTICTPGPDGNFPRLSNEYGVGDFSRLWRFVRRVLPGEVSASKRLDKYHDISRYRCKLRAFAIRRLTEFPVQDDDSSDLKAAAASR